MKQRLLACLGSSLAGAGDRSFAAQAPRVCWRGRKAPLTLLNQRVAVLYGALLSGSINASKHVALARWSITEGKRIPASKYELVRRKKQQSIAFIAATDSPSD